MLFPKRHLHVLCIFGQNIHVGRAILFNAHVCNKFTEACTFGTFIYLWNYEVLVQVHVRGSDLYVGMRVVEMF